MTNVDPLVVISTKVPPHLLEQIDAKVERMRELSPGAVISRSDAIRALLSCALDRERTT